MEDKEKRFLAGSVINDMIPNEYVSDEEYGPESTLLNTTIVWDGDIPIAFCDVWMNSHMKGEIAIGTRPTHRGKGYATKAMQETIEWFCGMDGLDALCYYSHTENKASIALAQKLGFEVTFQDDQVTCFELEEKRYDFGNPFLGIDSRMDRQCPEK